MTTAAPTAPPPPDDFRLPLRETFLLAFGSPFDQTAFRQLGQLIHTQALDNSHLFAPVGASLVLRQLAAAASDVRFAALYLKYVVAPKALEDAEGPDALVLSSLVTVFAEDLLGIVADIAERLQPRPPGA